MEQTEDILSNEIQKSHVVCVVYSVEDDNTLDRITSHWLPLLRECVPDDQRRPVVLVGNKTDLVDYSTIDVSIIGLRKHFTEAFQTLVFNTTACTFNNGRFSRSRKLCGMLS